MQVPLWPFFFLRNKNYFNFSNKLLTDWNPSMSFASKQFKLREKPSLGWTARKKKKKKKITKSSSFHIFKILSQDWWKLQIGCKSGHNHFFHLKLFVNLFFIWRPEFFFVFQKIRLGNKVFFPGSGKPKYLLEFFLGRASLLLVQSRGFRTKS